MTLRRAHPPPHLRFRDYRLVFVMSYTGSVILGCIKPIVVKRENYIVYFAAFFLIHNFKSRLIRSCLDDLGVVVHALEEAMSEREGALTYFRAGFSIGRRLPYYYLRYRLA